MRLHGVSAVSLRCFSIAVGLALSLATPVAHAQCNGCEGDLNGDKQVTIDELIMAVNNALNGCEELFFKENFSGTAIDPTRWNVFTNGYPAPAFSVQGGFLQLGQPGTVSLDFPYVSSAVPLFPASGDFRLEIVMEYTSTEFNGSSLVVLGAGNEKVFEVHSDRGATGLLLMLFRPDFTGSGARNLPGGSHTYTVDVVGSNGSVSVDGAVVLSNVPLGVRPQSIWFGQPTIGQLSGIEHPSFSFINSEGVYTARPWSAGPWTTLRIDSISVRLL